jgi:hypothetical protein
MRHLGYRVQEQILLSFAHVVETAAEKDEEQRSMAAMAIAISCLEGFGRRKPEQALRWILHAACLGSFQAKSHVYRISQVLGADDNEASRALAFGKEAAKAGSQAAFEDVTTAWPEFGQQIVREFEERVRIECQFIPA